MSLFKSCIAFVLFASVGCGTEEQQTTATISHIGLSVGSIVPPLGVGVNPSTGRGGDGNFQPTRVGGWSGGPGAIEGYGGQWLIPISPPGGSTIANVSCDVSNPTPGVVDTFELVSGDTGVVVASQNIPSSTSVVFRTWLIGAFAVGDGANWMMRHNARGPTGAWASQAERPTVISCAVNAVQPVTDVYSAGFAIAGPGAQVFPGAAATNASLSLNTSTASNNLPLRVPVGRTLTGWSVRLIRNSGTGTIAMRLWRSVAGSGAAVQVGATQTNVGPSGAVVAVGQSGLVEPIAGTSYFIEVTGGGASGDFVEDYQDTWQ